MKMERLIGILSILLQREKVTAPELAEQFEVSRRTIQRDIESLCRAGIPIATAQGAGGGTRIHCTETVNARRWWMCPFVPGYLKRQQRLYLDDLRKELLK